MGTLTGYLASLALMPLGAGQALSSRLPRLERLFRSSRA